MSWAGSLAVIRLPAEIDIATVRQVDEELNSLLIQRPATLVADMTQTRFCDSSGIASLLRAARRATALAIPLRVACSEQVLRMVRLVRADRVLDVYPTLAAAGSGVDGAG